MVMGDLSLLQMCSKSVKNKLLLSESLDYQTSKQTTAKREKAKAGAEGEKDSG